MQSLAPSSPPTRIEMGTTKCINFCDTKGTHLVFRKIKSVCFAGRARRTSVLRRACCTYGKREWRQVPRTNRTFAYCTLEHVTRRYMCIFYLRSSLSYKYEILLSIQEGIWAEIKRTKKLLEDTILLSNPCGMMVTVVSMTVAALCSCFRYCSGPWPTTWQIHVRSASNEKTPV